MDEKQELRALSCRGLRSEYSAIDRDLWLWYSRAKSTSLRPVSKSLLQKHAKLAFSRAGISNFKASDGWYRRWMSRWQKKGPAIGNISTQPAGQTCIVDRMKILHDVASQHLSVDTQIVGSKYKVLTREDTCHEQDATTQPQFLDSIQENVNKSSLPEQDVQPTLLSDSPLTTKEQSPSDCFMNELFKQACVGGNNFKSGKSSLEFNDSSDSKDQCENHLHVELTKQKKPKSVSCLEDENLDIMDYLALHIAESCDSSQFGGANNCMFHSNTMDHILGSCDSVGSMLSCSTHSNQHARLPCDSLAPQNLGPDHLQGFAGLVSQLGATPPTKGATPGCDRPSVRDEDIATSSRRSQSNKKSVHLPDAASLTETPQAGPRAKEPAPAKQKAGGRDVAAAPGDKKKKRKKKSSEKQHKKGERYLPKFKEKVLAYAMTHTFKDTARKFKVNNATISAWKKDKVMVNSEVRVRQRLPGGEAALQTVQTPEGQFLAWLRQCRERNHEVTREEVRLQAEQLVAQCSSQPRDSSSQGRWFLMWAERLKKQLCEEELELWVISGKEKEQHIQYPMTFKMEVAEFADRYSQIKSSKTFSVSRKRVFEWLKVFRRRQKGTEAALEAERRGPCGRVATDVEVDRQIWEWYRAQPKKPSGHEVRTKGAELYRARGHAHMKCSYGWYRRWSGRFQVSSGQLEEDGLLLEWVLERLEQGRAVSHADLQAHALLLLADKAVPFKASSGWAIRFCKRYPELLYHSPTVESRLPRSLMTKVEDFRSLVRRVALEKAVQLSALGSMDELHINLSTLLPVTAESGARRQLLRRPELASCHVTIVLACLANGALLPPVVIAKGNFDAASEEKEVPVVFQENAHMDEKCMKFWLETVWFKKVSSPSVLVMDCYEAHSLPSIADLCASRGTCCLVIPGGCASKLQPIDVALKRSFQDAIEKQWLAFGGGDSKSWGTKHKLQLPGHQKIVEWVSTTCTHVLDNMQETIRQSFLVTGLSIADNHSEEDLIDNLSMVAGGNRHFSMPVQSKVT